MKKLGNKKTLPELAVEQIITYINQNNLQSGDQLPNEIDLMNKLNVGRGTIREAIKSLNSKGVVVIKRGVGTFVAEQPGVSDDPLGFIFETDKTKLLKDALEVRLLIEPSMIIKAIENISDEQIDEMIALAKEIEDLIKKNKDYTTQDVAFHTLLARASGNRVIEKLIPIITVAIEQAIDLTDRSLAQETIITHHQIVEAVKNRDKDKARLAMNKHIQDNIDVLNSIISKR